MLTLHWAEKKEILSMAELGLVDASEYLGALSDFTGEIGRMAVTAASARRTEEVATILQADIVIYHALLKSNSSGRFNKKCEAVATNLKKVHSVAIMHY